MKTFRFSLVALAATALITACSDEAVVEQRLITSEAQEISFRLQGGTPETRAMATTIDNIDAFVVYGTDSVANVAGTNIFDGVTVARQKGTGAIFDYNPKKYYSAEIGKAAFIAYSPVSASLNISGLDATSLLTTTSFDYVVNAPDGSGEAVQEDLLVAGKSVAVPSVAKVDLNFKHALSRIFVKAKNSLKENVVITGLTLKNLYSEGTITGTPASPAWTWAWSNYSNITSYDYVLARTGVAVKAGVTTATLVTSMEQGMMVLPQEIVNSGDDHTAGDFALEVTYDVANLTAQKAYVYLADTYPFEYNTQYAITIEFSGTDLIEIGFTIDVAGFDDDPATMP